MAVYAIRVLGQVDAHWSVWFDGLTISNASAGQAMISGEIADQAALHGALNKIRNLNLALISVIKVDPGSRRANPPDRPIAPILTFLACSRKETRSALPIAAQESPRDFALPDIGTLASWSKKPCKGVVIRPGVTA